MNELHYECELVLRVSKNGKYIQEKFASKYYDAVSVGIDFTARDLQDELKSKGLPWEKAKAWDNSAVVGKWTPFTSIKNRKEIIFSLKKNKEVVQDGNSQDMIFDFDYIVSHISNFFSVNIGDLIFTGTPKGVGEVRLCRHRRGSGKGPGAARGNSRPVPHPAPPRSAGG